jgi:GNAT superfamily N-acetyltransferase
VKIRWELPLDPEGVRGELDDGSPFVVRPIRTTDGPGLEAAFAQMSTRSRYLRFFAIRDRLGDALVKSLTDIDHDRHRAWVVADPDSPSDVGDSEGRGIAVARLISVDGEPGVAEASLAVVDDYQGRGFGRVLLELLLGTARDTGVAFIRFETLYENRGMRSLLAGMDARKNDELSNREVLVFDVPVVEDDDGVAFGALYEILRFIASSEQVT